MSIQSFINYVIENKEIILIVLIIGVFATTLVRGAKKILSALITVMFLFAALSFFGVPMDMVNQQFQDGISRFEDGMHWAQDVLPGYVDAANDYLTESSSRSAGSTATVSHEDVDGEVMVHFLDVGQADCIFIEDEDDTLLIDVGNRADDETVVQYLDGLGITQIDYFVATHPHEDHIGCAATILRLFDVDTMIKSDVENTTACYTSMMEQAEESGVRVELADVGETYQLGEGSFQILGPVSISDDLNNDSVVILYQYGNTRFLFTGDAERDEEAEILELGYDLNADVLKVGHHGSSTSTSYPWLREVMPEYAVIMCGEDNEYGHPHEETLSKLHDADVNVYRTDINGTIVFTSDGDSVTPYPSAA